METYIGQAFDLRPTSLRRRRFLMVSVAVLAVLGMALGVSFMSDSGATTVGVTQGPSSFVFPVAATNPVPDGVTSLKYTPVAGITQASDVFASGVVLPGWTPIANSAGTIGTAGDLALIDATDLGNSPAIQVGMYITNLDALQRMYSSYAFDIEVYEATKSACHVTNGCSWALNTTLTAADSTFLTHTDAFLQFSMAEGKLYVITIDDGGSFYCISTTAAGGSLSPSFYFTGQPS